METQMTGFITPMKVWEPIEGIGQRQEKRTENQEATVFQNIFQDVVSQVYSSQADVEEKQYLLSTGQLDDAHTLPIAEAKAAVSLEVLIALRNKALESYNELMRISL